MRGKIKASTRFRAFRENMLLKFKDDASVMSDFISFLRDPTPIDQLISRYCDETESLLYLEPGPPTAIYQVLRLINKPTLLRDLEVLSQHIWGLKGVLSLYTAISVLYSVNLIDYKHRDYNSTPSNVIQFFVKEDES